MQTWFWEPQNAPHWLLMSGAIFATIISVVLAAFWPAGGEATGLAFGGFPGWIAIALLYSLICWVIQDAVKVR